ncbi:hypothetical protein IAG44_37475 [Streptomyces roseirectus]|uniref:Glycosyltransferase n=1 Tax=Streptomyces roseirectus TaxID=2768066 RepID=A0A7H0IP71_9ACTN|nr:hypothetical protein [Streptomyces roseirectus]QNP74587.1 hypothetical protein IAG44_37475 [Streptomyces roseirectus]
MGPRILLNAEAFGFGPAAAAAVLADELAASGAEVGYLGGGHTLDLQHRPPYAAVHDVTGLSEAACLDRLRVLAGEYDAFLTSMDFALGLAARQAGFRVAVYDALAWFWPGAWPVVRDESVLYVAQEFFGVRERVASDAELAGRTVLVPPLVSPGGGWRGGGRQVVVNLGGLCNPFWAPGEVETYARIVVSGVRAGVPSSCSVLVATSEAIARALGDSVRGVTVGTYRRDQVLDLLRAAPYAFMTPGLGNLYDAAAVGVPTVLLPATNTTQARQADVVAAQGYCDARVDWADFGLAVDFGDGDPEMTGVLTAALRELGAEGDGRFGERVAASVREMGHGRASGLLERFGVGGGRVAAGAVLKWVQSGGG